MIKIESYWASLGITFESADFHHFSPEEAIIETIKSGEFPKDRKMFSLMYLWLLKNHGYVHVERLKNFSKNLDLLSLAFLGGVSLKMCKLNHKWKSLVIHIKKKIGTEDIKFPKIKDSDFFIKRHGLDLEFFEFGMNVALLKSANEKKILSEDKIIKLNKWIKNRCLFGVNLRADMATIIELNLAKTAYEASKLLKCTSRASYDNWGALLKSGWPNL